MHTVPNGMDSIGLLVETEPRRVRSDVPLIQNRLHNVFNSLRTEGCDDIERIGTFFQSVCHSRKDFDPL